MERIQCFCVRIVKGLLARHYPSVDRRGMQFGLIPLNQFLDPHELKMGDDGYVEYGCRTFEAWRRINQGTTGLWALRFYEAFWAAIIHQGPEKWSYWPPSPAYPILK